MASGRWSAILQSDYFKYKMEGRRGWSPESIIQLLEACYHEYQEIMGAGQNTWIEVEDRISISGRPAARRINGTIICEFPQGFGSKYDELKLAYHFFAHEVFHHWVGGYTVSHGKAIEALTQYMANRTLAKLQLVRPDQLERDRQKRQEGDEGEIGRYYLLFDSLELRKGKAILYQLCQELANCFKQAQSEGRRADVWPILRQYLNPDIIDAEKT